MPLQQLWKGGPTENISVEVDEASGEVLVVNTLGVSVKVSPREDWPGHLVVSSPNKVKEGWGNEKDTLVIS